MSHSKKKRGVEKKKNRFWKVATLSNKDWKNINTPGKFKPNFFATAFLIIIKA